MCRKRPNMCSGTRTIDEIRRAGESAELYANQSGATTDEFTGTALTATLDQD